MRNIIQLKKGHIMAGDHKISKKARSLKVALQAWIEKNHLEEDTIWWPPKGDDSTGNRPDLVLTFEGNLHSVLWCRPCEDHDDAAVSRLRREFDVIVKKHGFFFQFKNEVEGRFYENE
jgi:hypothetical protein